MSDDDAKSEVSGVASCDASLSFQAFIGNIAKISPLRTLDSLLSEDDFHVDAPTILFELAFLLTSLRVPVSYAISPDQIFLGNGAHFTVFRQKWIAVAEFQDQNLTLPDPLQPVAIKIPNILRKPGQKADLSDLKNCRQVRSMMLEITALCHPKLRGHPNLVKLLAWGMDTDDWRQVPFIALEIAVMDLDSLLQSPEDVTNTGRYRLVLDIACGLDAIHEIGLIHGDLKPGNVLMFFDDSGHWVAKLADFGGAVNVGKDGFWEGGGTVGWRAPEVRDSYESGKTLDLSLLDRADNYSFGLLLWSVLLAETVEEPHDETQLNVEEIALADLLSNRENLSESLIIALKNSFSSLLKVDPRLRSNRVMPLLAIESQEYIDETDSLQTFYREHNVSQQNCENGSQLDWDIPEISALMIDGLETAFANDKELPPRILYAMLLKVLSDCQDLDSHIDEQNLLLKLVCAAARQGHKASRSIVFRIHEYFDVLPPPDISSAKLSWVADSVSQGAFFLRADLQKMDAGVYNECVASFRNSGGFSRRDTTLPVKHSSSITQRFSKDESDDLKLLKSLNSHGDNALHIVASSHQSSELSHLLDSSNLEEINAVNFRGETPLYRACMAGLMSNILQLLSRGADASISASEEGPGCLHWIFQFDPSDINFLTKKLIGHGASIHTQCKQKIAIQYYPFRLPVGTALHWAVEMSVLEAVTALLDNGADLFLRDGSNPYEFDFVIRQLDRISAPDLDPFSISERPTMGLNAFDLAVKNRDHRVLGQLFSKESRNIAGETDEEGYSAIHRLDTGHELSTMHGTRVWKPCLEGSKTTQKEALNLTIALLLKHGFRLDQLTKPQEKLKPRRKSQYGLEFPSSSTLMLAIANYHVDTARTLIEAGANVECANGMGRTALHSVGACWELDPSLESTMVEILPLSKSNINILDVNDASPLVMAVSRRLTVFALALLELGADFCVHNDFRGGLIGPSNVLAELCICDVTGANDRDQWIAMVLERFVLPGLREGNGRIKKEVITEASARGENFLHFTADSGLQVCCRLLLDEKVVDCNQLGKKIKYRGRIQITSYQTPLDKAYKGLKRLKSDYLEIDNQSAKPLWGAGMWFGTTKSLVHSPTVLEEATRQLAVYEEIIQLLQAHGGVKGKTLKAKTYESEENQNLLSKT